MKHISLAAIATLLALLDAPARADISIVDNDQNVDVDCAKDPQVQLVGNHITVTTRGVCAKIVIMGNHETVTGSANVVVVLGNHNTVALDAADEVSVPGNDNTVAVRKAVTLKEPRISALGRGNRVSRPK